MKKTAKKYIGWLGTVFVLGSYMLLSLGIIDSDWRYHTSVLLGSTCLTWVASRAKIWELVVLNASFTFFALIALARSLA